MQTLRNLVAMADEEVKGRVDVLLDRITDKIADDLYRYTVAFIQSSPEKTSVGCPTEEIKHISLIITLINIEYIIISCQVIDDPIWI